MTDETISYRQLNILRTLAEAEDGSMLTTNRNTARFIAHGTAEAFERRGLVALHLTRSGWRATITDKGRALVAATTAR